MKERMEGKLKRIVEELEGMKKREEEWRKEREMLEKRVADGKEMGGEFEIGGRR